VCDIFLSIYSTASIVAQNAGKLMGYLPGDLGDMGLASLTFSQVLTLLSGTCNTTALTKLLKRKELFDWPVSFEVQGHLELCARLLSCGQRYYISDAECRLVEDPEALLLSMIEAPEDDDTPEWVLFRERKLAKVPTCSPSIVLASPFYEYILAPLSRLIDRQHFQLHGSLPILNALYELPISALKQSDIKIQNIALLQILGACTELFPSGACWASISQSSWKELRLDSDNLTKRFRQIRCCTPDDLAGIVSLVVSMLEMHGGPSGEADVQRWTTICLMHLADSTAVIRILYKGRASEFGALEKVWRRLWNIIFRSDLRYKNQTKVICDQSIGSLVCNLLTRLIRHRCTDMVYTQDQGSKYRATATFLYKRQLDIWLLPFFSDTSSISSSTPFELISEILRVVPLCDSGRDAISTTSILQDCTSSQTRRVNLVNYCLQVLSEKDSDTLSGPISLCLAVLIHGPRVFDNMIGLNNQNLEFPLRYEASDHGVLSFVRSRSDVAGQLVRITPTFWRILWMEQRPCIPQLSHNEYMLCFDSVSSEQIMLHTLVAKEFGFVFH
jgi:hypothetical protein